jgi:hypothetical protein
MKYRECFSLANKIKNDNDDDDTDDDDDDDYDDYDDDTYYVWR